MKNGDLISRQAVLDRKYVVEVQNMWHMTEEIEVVNVDDIKALPPVNPQEPKTGHWIDQYNDENWHCDRCGAIVEKDEQNNHNWYFCYHCGAKMVEPQESEGEE